MFKVLEVKMWESLGLHRVGCTPVEEGFEQPVEAKWSRNSRPQLSR